jgi:hypothetical protein
MNCTGFHKNIPSWLENTCEPEQEQMMKSHLETCESCSLLLQKVQLAMQAAIEDVIHQEDVYFYSRLRSRLGNPASGKKKYSLQYTLGFSTFAIAASIFLGIVLGNNLMHYESTSVNSALSSTDPIVSELSMSDLNTPSSVYYELFNDDTNDSE